MSIPVAHVLLMTAKGGGEVWISNVLPYLCEADDFSFQFVSHTTRPNFLSDELQKASLSLEAAPPRTRLIRYLWFFFHYFRSHRVQIVHVHIQMHSAFVLLAAWAAGVRIRILHSHSADLGKACNSGWFWGTLWKCYRAACRWIIRRTATHVFHVSRQALADVCDSTHSTAGTAPLRLWIPPAVDVRPANGAADCPEPARCRDDVFRIACIGRMHESRFLGNPKNQQLVIATAARLQANPLPMTTEFYLVGDGTARQTLEQLVEKLGLSGCVRFTGELADVIGFLWRDVDLVLAPSTHEGFGMTVLEAQLQGVPVIVSENIPSEAIVSEGLVARQTLQSGPEGWADAVRDQWRRIQNQELDSKRIERQRTLELIRETIYTPPKNAVAMLDAYRHATSLPAVKDSLNYASAIPGEMEGDLKWR